MESMSPAALSQRYGDITQVVDHDGWTRTLFPPPNVKELFLQAREDHLARQRHKGLVTHGSNATNIYQQSHLPTVDLTELGGNRGNPNNSGHTPYLRSQIGTRPPGKLSYDLFRNAKHKLPLMSEDMTGTWDQYRIKLFNFLGTYGLTPENIANAPTPEIWFDRDQKLYQILTQAAENAQDKLYVITASNPHKSGTQAWYRLNELFAESSARGKVQILQRLQKVLQSPRVPAAGESFEVCNRYFYQIINLGEQLVALNSDPLELVTLLALIRFHEVTGGKYEVAINEVLNEPRLQITKAVHTIQRAVANHPRQPKSNDQTTADLWALSAVSKTPTNSKQSKFHQHITCSNCGRRGHYGRDCRASSNSAQQQAHPLSNKRTKRNKRKSPTPQTYSRLDPNLAYLSHVTHPSTGPISFMALSQSIPSDVILLDSGCSKTMTGDRNLFQSLEQLPTPRRITVANGETMEITQVGQIQVKMKTTKGKTITVTIDADYVPSPAPTLVAVRDLTDRNFVVSLGPQRWELSTPRGDTVILGDYHGSPCIRQE